MLAVENLCFGFGEQKILHNITFQAQAHEFIAILGPNGSGKTTLLQCIAQIHTSQTGTITIQNHKLKNLSCRQRGKLVAVVPQKPNLQTDLLVRDFVLLGRYAHLNWMQNYQSADYAAVDVALSQAGAAEFASRQLSQLSGGQLQRVLVAQALAQQTDLLLLDEPAQGVDQMGILQLFSLLLDLCRAGKCILCVLHDPNIAAALATKILGLKAGQILFFGEPKTTFTQENLSNLYDVPITIAQLANSSLVFSYPEALEHLRATPLYTKSN